MASGRMLQRKIALNKDIPRLVAIVDQRLGAPHGAYAALVYTWSIAFLDVEGRMHGDPVVVKSLVATRLGAVTAVDVEAYLMAMAEVGLVLYYEANGDRWLAFLGFKNSQPGLRPDKEGKATSPAPEEGRSLSAMHDGPTPDLLRTYSGPPADLLPPKRREEKEKGSEETSPTPARVKEPESPPWDDLRLARLWVECGVTPTVDKGAPEFARVRERIGEGATNQGLPVEDWARHVLAQFKAYTAREGKQPSVLTLWNNFAAVDGDQLPRTRDGPRKQSSSMNAESRAIVRKLF